jgi:uncharacterized integral membrane protein
MKFVTGVILGIMVVLFIIQNLEIVEISFLFWTLSISRALMIFLVFSVGVILGIILRSMVGKNKINKKRLG